MHTTRRHLLQLIGLATGASAASRLLPRITGGADRAQAAGLSAASQSAWKSSTLGQSPPVPQPFRALYTFLDQQLARVEQGVAAAITPATTPPPLTFELLTANSNRGEQLFRPGTVEASALLMDRLLAIGVHGITLSINYPVLTTDLPRFDDYLAFYRRIAEEAHGRGLRLTVETTSIFPDPEFSSLGVDYSGLTLEQYQRGKRFQAETILRELRPDHLTVESESTTISRNTGLPYTVDDYLNTVRFVLDGLDRGDARVGAGSGSWDDLGLFQRLAAETTVDYIDVHFYPVSGDLLWDRAGRIAAIARDNGKGLTVGESWLYKIGPNEPAGAQATAVNVFGRDAYSFWSPLDQRFIRVMAALAGGLAMEFCSLYWVQYLFGYLDFTPEVGQLPYAQRQARLNAIANANIVSGTLSPTGEALKALLA